MGSKIFKKILVFVITTLFIEASVIPSFNGFSIKKNSDKKIFLKIEQTNDKILLIDKIIGNIYVFVN